MAHQVFVSYAEEDRAAMLAFRDRLERQGVACWEARRDIAPGVDYADAIMSAIESSRAMLVLVSRASDASPHVIREVERAVELGVPIVPVRIDRTPLSRRMRYFLGPAQYAEVTGEDALEIDRVVRALAMAHGTPPGADASDVASPRPPVPSDAATRLAVRGRAPEPPPSGRTSDGVVVLSPSDLNARGVTTRQLIDELIEIDFESLDGASRTDVGHTETWTPVVEVNPDGMRLVVDERLRILAYWHFLPLDDATYERAKRGCLDDGEVRVENLNVIGLPGDYNMHFMIVCIRRGHRGVVMMRLLLDAFTDVLTQLARRDIYFPEVCATAFTPEGEALCKTVRMRATGRHVHRGTVYQLDMTRLPPTIFYVPELRDRYASHFGASRVT